MTRDRIVAGVLFVLGVVALAMAVVDASTPLRPIVTLAFFCAAPGAAVVRGLRVRDPLLAASLAVGISLVVSMAVAMAMLWAGVSSPVFACAVTLAFTAIAMAVGTRSEEVLR